MIVNNGENAIPLPELIRTGDPITARWANSIRSSIQKLRDRKPTVERQTKINRLSYPFEPSIRLNGEQWQISVARGLVVEKIATADEGDDALLYWEPSNILTAGLPTWFDIENNQSIFAVVTESNSGTVRVITSVVLEVAASDTLSLAYIPGVQDGVYYYELAKFIIVDGKPVIERYTSGSHIYHEVTTTGWWGTILNEFFVNNFDSSPYTALETKYENGIVVEVKYQEPGGSLTVVDGTRAAPGTVNFATFATPS
jgi:hypothetical protein